MDITLLNEVWDLIISAFSPLRKRFSRDGTVWESSPVQWDLARYSVSLSFPLPAGIFLEPALSSGPLFFPFSTLAPLVAPSTGGHFLWASPLL